MATQSNTPMVSEVSICNQALTWIGANPITSLDQKSKSAEWCRVNYPFIRDAVIEEVMWSFARVRYVSVTANKDAFDQLWEHPVPENWLQVFYVYNDNSLYHSIHDDNWIREGESILTSNSTSYFKGVVQITDTGKFSNLFVQALAARMAADAAVPLAKNAKLQADMWALYVSKIHMAGARDGQQGSNDRIQRGKLSTRRG